MSSKDLGKACFVSTATVYRLCDKLNLAGFSDLKIKITSSLNDYLKSNGDFNFDFPVNPYQTHYEIDFIIPKKNKICPIEVKSSNYKKHTSIDEFYKKYSSRILERYIIHTKDVSKDQDILCLPIYLTQFIL